MGEGRKAIGIGMARRGSWIAGMWAVGSRLGPAGRYETANESGSHGEFGEIAKVVLHLISGDGVNQPHDSPLKLAEGGRRPDRDEQISQLPASELLLTPRDDHGLETGPPCGSQASFCLPHDYLGSATLPRRTAPTVRWLTGTYPVATFDVRDVLGVQLVLAPANTLPLIAATPRSAGCGSGGLTGVLEAEMRKAVLLSFVVTVLAFALCGCELIGPRPPTGASLGDSWKRPADGAVMVYVPARASSRWAALRAICMSSQCTRSRWTGFGWTRWR